MMSAGGGLPGFGNWYQASQSNQTDTSASAFFPGTGTNTSDPSSGITSGVSKNIADALITLVPGTPFYNAPGQTQRAGDQFQGDQYDPGQVFTGKELLASFYSWSPATLASRAQELLAAGFFPNTYYDASAPPITREAIFKAWEGAIQAAALTGLSIPDLLTKGMDAQAALASGRPMGPGIIGGGNHYTMQLTNPEDLAAYADKEAQQLFGRKATAKEKQLVGSVITNQEKAHQGAVFASQEAAQRQNFDMKTAGLGGAPSLPAGDKSELSQFMAATRMQESSNSYSEHGGGAYQFVQGTWDEWARKAGLSQWVGKNPASAPSGVQDKVAATAMISYFEGPAQHDWAKVAMMWNGGVPHPVPNPALGPGATTATYAQQVLAKMGKTSGAPGPPAPTYVPPTVDTATQPADPGVAALDALRQQNPVESGAHDIASTFGMFLNLIQGGMSSNQLGGQQPSPVAGG